MSVRFSTDTAVRFSTDTPIRFSTDTDKEKAGIASHIDEPRPSRGTTPEHVINSRFGPVLGKMFARGVESRGVERVPEDERETKNMYNNLIMWCSVNTVLTTIPIGVISQSLFTLTLPHAIATIMSFGALGATATAFIATLGPKTGLRTMCITRFSSGYIGGIIYSILNILTQLGFATSAVILGGQALASINPGTLPLVAGVVIVGVGSLIPCFIGYRFVHIYERYAWIVMTIVMLMLWGLGAQAGYDINAQRAHEDSGRTHAADVLKFGGIVFGGFMGWAPIAADYNCRLPTDTSSLKIFLLTFFGLWIPTCFVEILGAALMTITKPAYVQAFAQGGTGALLGQVLSPWMAGGKVILFLLAFSVVANNIPNTYSAGLSMQSLGRPFAFIPRFFWTCLAFVIYTVAGVVGREHFFVYLSNFLSILSYWTAFFVVIVAEEHFLFRKGGIGYDLDEWDTPSGLPYGIAGIIAGCCGVAGAIVGMSEVWYIGPIAMLAGGADLGFELAAAFSAITYPPIRWLEIRYTGR